MNEEVARYIAEAPLDQGETMEAIRKIIHRKCLPLWRTSSGAGLFFRLIRISHISRRRNPI